MNGLRTITAANEAAGQAQGIEYNKQQARAWLDKAAVALKANDFALFANLTKRAAQEVSHLV